jgi:redox-sensitive bicupin YhaK (pirin superfamily)
MPEDIHASAAASQVAGHAAALPRLRPARPLPVSRLDARLSSREIHQALTESELDPFLVVSLFEMSGPVFPPHPHAGFTVATYILPESHGGFVNQDSLGTRNEILPGGVHATVAGSGVLHEEQPISIGTVVRGYQIWIDHRNGERSVPPRPETLEASGVPIAADDAATVRVLLGSSHGLESPLRVPTPVRLLDVTIAPGRTWEAAIPAEEQGFVVLMAGGLSASGVVIPEGHVAPFGSGADPLRLSAGPDGARLTLFAGVPLSQPRVFGGPVVGGSRAEVDAFLRTASTGGFGRLVPLSESIGVNQRR